MFRLHLGPVAPQSTEVGERPKWKAPLSFHLSGRRGDGEVNGTEKKLAAAPLETVGSGSEGSHVVRRLRAWIQLKVRS